MAKEINWLEVRAGYEAGVPVRSLAALFGIGSIGTISKRADREGWAKPEKTKAANAGKPSGPPGDGTLGNGKRKRRKKPVVSKAPFPVQPQPAVGPAATDPEDDWDGERDELTERERRFVMHYACCGVGSIAARRAGYAADSARFRARDLLNRPRVQAAIEEMRAERAARLGISADRVVQELVRHGMVSMTDLAKWGPEGVELRLSDDLSPDDAAAIVEVSETKDGVRIKLAPKQQALRLLAEHTGVVGKRGGDGDQGRGAPAAISADPMTVDEWEAKYGAGVGAAGGAAEGSD